MKIWGRGKRYRSRLLTYFMAFGTVFITVSMVQYPKESFDSAIMGLNLWWNVVFPALLPFFILSEILMGLGVVHFIGVLLEPLMRPLFNVPGVGAFALPPICHNNNIRETRFFLTAKQEAFVSIIVKILKRVKAEEQTKESQYQKPNTQQ